MCEVQLLLQNIYSNIRRIKTWHGSFEQMENHSYIYIYIHILAFFPGVSCLNTGSLRGFWSIGFPSSKEKNARFIRIYSCRVWSTPNIIYYIIMYRERERDLKTLHVSTLLRKIMEKMDQSCTQKWQNVSPKTIHLRIYIKLYIGSVCNIVIDYNLMDSQCTPNMSPENGHVSP